nr:hypothetical protein [Tanacetum cinerariifolium]
ALWRRCPPKPDVLLAGARAVGRVVVLLAHLAGLLPPAPGARRGAGGAPGCWLRSRQCPRHPAAGQWPAAGPGLRPVHPRYRRNKPAGRCPTSSQPGPVARLGGAVVGQRPGRALPARPDPGRRHALHRPAAGRAAEIAHGMGPGRRPGQPGPLAGNQWRPVVVPARRPRPAALRRGRARPAHPAHRCLADRAVHGPGPRLAGHPRPGLARSGPAPGPAAAGERNPGTAQPHRGLAAAGGRRAAVGRYLRRHCALRPHPGTAG